MKPSLFVTKAQLSSSFVFSVVIVDAVVVVAVVVVTGVCVAVAVATAVATAAFYRSFFNRKAIFPQRCSFFRPNFLRSLPNPHRRLESGSKMIWNMAEAMDVIGGVSLSHGAPQLSIKS